MELAVSAAKGGEGVPAFREDPRVRGRQRADSVKRDALHEWLASSEGKQWQQDKKRRHEDGVA